MNEEVVERIEMKDPKALKIFFLLFFLLIPISGVLLMWNDGHTKIRKQADRFGKEILIPSMKRWDQEEIFELSTPEFSDELRQGAFDKHAEEYGPLVSYTKFHSSNTRAREEDDAGVIYAEVEFLGEFQKATGKVWIKIKSQSAGEITEDGKKRVEAWYIDSMEVEKR